MTIGKFLTIIENLIKSFFTEGWVLYLILAVIAIIVLAIIEDGI